VLTVIRTGDGAIAVNYLWLPTWIGMNASLVREIDDEVGAKWIGSPLTDETLLAAHTEVVQYLANRFKIEGLKAYLDGVRKVVEAGTT
jgi:hypothetical protein